MNVYITRFGKKKFTFIINYLTKHVPENFSQIYSQRFAFTGNKTEINLLNC